MTSVDKGIIIYYDRRVRVEKCQLCGQNQFHPHMHEIKPLACMETPPPPWHITTSLFVPDLKWYKKITPKYRGTSLTVLNICSLRAHNNFVFLCFVFLRRRPFLFFLVLFFTWYDGKVNDGCSDSNILCISW